MSGAGVAVQVKWAGEGQVFRGGAAGGVQVQLDGRGVAGPSPMQALLLALAGCTGADVVEILAKMRVPLTGLEVDVEGDRAEAAPRRYTAIRLRFRASGVPAEMEAQLRRAVALSAEKYCSVLHSLRPDVVVESDVALQ